MNRTGADGMWDEEDGFYYDLLRLPDGNATRLKVRSMVGLLPLCATTVIESGSGSASRRRSNTSSNGCAGCPNSSSACTRPAAITGRGRAGHPGAGQPGAPPPDPDADARRARVPESVRHPRAIQVPRAAPLQCSMSTARSTGSATSPRSRTPACSAATPTGGGRSGCRSTS